MSLLATFAHVSAREAVDESRRYLITQRDQLKFWLDRYEGDPQCDDVDREAVAKAREQLAHLTTALAAL